MAIDIQIEKEKELITPFSIGYWALRIHLAHHAMLAHELKDSGLSGAQIFFLNAVMRFKGEDPSLKDLARELGFTHPAVVRQINELEKSGFVEKYQSDKDKRVKYVRLTQKGSDFEPFMKNVFKSVEGTMGVGITYEEKGMVMEVLKKTYFNMTQKMKDFE